MSTVVRPLNELLADARMSGGEVFFVGVGGSGMSSLAQVVQHRGWRVAGSDRSHDRGESAELFQQLATQGIRLATQDGNGVTTATACVIASTAVEAEIPDLRTAERLGVPVVHRSDLLAWLVNGDPLGAIAVGGTSGKSTVTGMLGHILRELGQDPCVINGGIMVNAAAPPYPGNALCGLGRVVAEVDESDGTIVHYHAAVGIVNSVTEDHKPLPEIRQLFTTFANQVSGALIYHAACAESRALFASRPGAVSVALEPEPTTDGAGGAATMDAATAHADWLATDLRAVGLSTHFRMRGGDFVLPVPGRHNVQNALAAIAAAAAVGLDWRAAAGALVTFRGIQRRFDVTGTARGVTVVDDFGHNPEKIAATLATATAAFSRVLAVFQPHGYGPTRFLRAGLVDAMATGLRPGDAIYFPEIFYAGGTAEKTISSADLVADLQSRGVDAHFVPDRADLPAVLAARAATGDVLLLMGARDPSLPHFARTVLAAL